MTELTELEALVEFLESAAKYFETCNTQGEDRAHWANVYNAGNCRKAADAITQLTRERDEARAEVERLREGVGQICIDSNPDWKVRRVYPDGTLDSIHSHAVDLFYHKP